MNASRRSGLLPLLGRLWRNLYLAGRRRNHQLLGFYRYHLDTCKSVIRPLSSRVANLRKSPKAAKIVRNVLFWPMMALATMLLYTGVAPYAWRFVLPIPGSQFADTLPAGDITSKSVGVASAPVIPSEAPTESKQTADVQTAPEVIESDLRESSLPKAAEKVNQQTDVDNEDPVVEALAKLPAFVPEDAVMPVDGEIVQAKGWYRHPVYDDWRMSPGVVIEPENPGSVVQSAYSGVVVEVRKEENGVWSVLLAHKDGWESEYNGLDSASVQPHEVVKKGGSIGRAPVGEPKSVSFVLRHNDALMDPGTYLP